MLHVGECTPVMEYDNADDFSSVFIAKRRESYLDIHVPLDLTEICFSVIVVSRLFIYLNIQCPRSATCVQFFVHKRFFKV